MRTWALSSDYPNFRDFKLSLSFSSWVSWKCWNCFFLHPLVPSSKERTPNSMVAVLWNSSGCCTLKAVCRAVGIQSDKPDSSITFFQGWKTEAALWRSLSFLNQPPRMPRGRIIISFSSLWNTIMYLLFDLYWIYNFYVDIINFNIWYNILFLLNLFIL